MKAQLEEASDWLCEIRDDKQDSFDDLPERLQYSRTGEAMQNAIDEMDSIDCDIHSVMDRVSDMIKPSKKSM